MAGTTRISLGDHFEQFMKEALERLQGKRRQGNVDACHDLSAHGHERQWKSADNRMALSF